MIGGGNVPLQKKEATYLHHLFFFKHNKGSTLIHTLTHTPLTMKYVLSLSLFYSILFFSLLCSYITRDDGQRTYHHSFPIITLMMIIVLVLSCLVSSSYDHPNEFINVYTYNRKCGSIVVVIVVILLAALVSAEIVIPTSRVAAGGGNRGHSSNSHHGAKRQTTSSVPIPLVDDQEVFCVELSVGM